MKKNKNKYYKIYIKTIFEKTTINQKIPKEIAYTRKTALGIGLIKLLIAVETLALKLHVGNKRAKNRIAKLLSIIEDLQFIENRINEIPINANHKEKYSKRT